MSVNDNYSPIVLESEILNIISQIGITQNMFPGVRPSVTLTTGMNDFIVVRSTTENVDLDAYGKTILAVEIYVKDKQNIRDSAKLSSARNLICRLLPIITNRYIFSYSSETPILSDSNGFSFLAIKLFTIIKNNN